MFRIAGLDHARLRHLKPKIVAFTGTFADAGEDGKSAVLLGDVVDQFLNENCFADASAAEQSDLAAFEKRLDQINNFYAGLEHFGARSLFVKQRCRAMNGMPLLALNRAEIVDRLANHIHDAAQSAMPHRHGNRSALINGFHAANHAFGGFHGDAAGAAFSQMLLHFENDVDRAMAR